MGCKDYICCSHVFLSSSSPSWSVLPSLFREIISVIVTNVYNSLINNNNNAWLCWHIHNTDAGFRSVLTACWRARIVQFQWFSNVWKPSSTTCKHPYLYANWDGIYLTEAAYRNIVSGSIVAKFSNFSTPH